MEYTLRPYQEEAREAVEKEWENGNKKTLLVMATGCHKKGELLMLSNGDLKPVEAISKSDRLMGSDGNPRHILAMHHGVEDMYKITPKRGNDPFIVTKDHVLTLINNLDEYIDITVEDFLKLKKVRQTNLYLKRSDAIKKFEGQTNKLNSDLSEAYILGVFYNNSSASKQCVRVALPNETIAKVFKKWCKKHKYEISEMTDNSICLKKGKNNEEKPYDYALKYGFADMKRKDSSIPDFIKKAPLEFRMNFLAATIDICGTKNGSAFQVNKSSRQFAEDLIFMARSCGLSAYLSKSRKVQKTGEIYEIYNVTIGGEVNKLPTIVKKNPLESRMNALKTRFDIEYVGRGEYFGFTVDGDNRYLLNGFTLTHNCGKTVCFSQIIKDQLSKGDKVLVIAHREELLNQAAEKIESMTGLKTAREKGQETAIGSESKIVIASIRTLQGDKRLNQFKRDEFGTIVVDEAHHIMADGYQKVMVYFEDAKVLGVTATADRGDKKDLGNYFDSIAYEYGIKQAVEEGYLCPLVAQTIPIDIDISNVKTSQGDYQLGELSTAIDPYLDEIAKQISNICRNRKTIIFTPLVETAKKMRDLLNKYGMKAAEVDGATDNREQILKDFRNNVFNVVVNPIILSEGYDEPSADCMVMLRPTQVRSLFCQAVGRITRLYPGKNNALILDFLWLTQKHNLIRPAALFNDDQDVIDAVTEEVNSNGGEVDLMMADRQARKRVIKQREESLARQLEEQRCKTAKFVDPLQFAYSVESQEIIQYQPMFKVDYKKPTKEQIEWLFDHGINADEIDSYGKAQRIKDTLMERYRKKLSTPKQIRFLEKRGFRRVGLWQFDQASEMIDKIANNNWFVPHGINPKTYVPRVETKK